MSININDGVELLQRCALGTAIAELYIAAQHTSQKASDTACELKDDLFVRNGFNVRIRQSEYNVLAIPDNSVY